MVGVELEQGVEVFQAVPTGASRGVWGRWPAHKAGLGAVLCCFLSHEYTWVIASTNEKPSRQRLQSPFTQGKVVQASAT